MLSQQHTDWGDIDAQFSHLGRDIMTGNYMGIIQYLLSLWSVYNHGSHIQSRRKGGPGPQSTAGTCTPRSGNKYVEDTM